jgi:outer membrane lipopolysaccharide assembly protein LptE/RlpB
MYKTFIIHLFMIFSACFLVSSCGYHIVGSKYLPFDSVAVRPVQNMTYEPRLEEKLHSALSRELIVQGITLASAGGAESLGRAPESGVAIEAKITAFNLKTIASVDEKVKEQEIIMLVDVAVIDKNSVSELKAVRSPIQITYDAAGTVGEAALNKERAVEKACAEVAKEIADRVIIRYVK